MKEENVDSCKSTKDTKGVSYGARLEQIRKAANKSPEDIAKLLGVKFHDYHEWETFDGELTMVLSLADIARIASVLGVRSRYIFDDDKQVSRAVSPAQLCEKIKEYLTSSAIDISTFEERIGFEVKKALDDSSDMLNWNVDCLRCVCKEIKINWLTALPVQGSVLET